MVHQMSDPIVIGRKKITKPKHVTKRNREAFEDGLKRLRAAFGKPGQCIINDSEAGYFAAGGRFVVMYANRSFDTQWSDRYSKCYDALGVKDAKPGDDTSLGIGDHCKLIRVKQSTP